VARVSFAVFAVMAAVLPAAAQQPVAPGGVQRNPVCVRLEGQLTAIDRGGVDPARADLIKRMEDAAGRQQADLDRLTAQSRRLGCEGRGLFSIFSEQPQQCGPLNNQIQQIRSNLDRALGELQRAQGSTADREGQRRTILASLGQNDCGPQYRGFANQGNSLSGCSHRTPTASNNPNATDMPQVNTGNGSYRTVCVRVCDGYYFPVSNSTNPSRFADDEKNLPAHVPCGRDCAV